MKILDLPKIDRPREKLEKYGISRLTDIEIIAILIRTGIEGANVLELSKQILKKILQVGIEKIAIKDLLEIKGLGQIKAGQILASIELGRRLLQNKKSELLLSPKSVWLEMKDLRASKKEHFVVFYLDTQNQIIQREIISIGTLNASLVHPREVFEPAIRHSTAQIILAHNHPSDSTEPSEEDIAVSRRLMEVGKIMGIDILDHVIVTKSSYVSMKELGLL